jgi:hypothetical protein
MSRKFLPIAIGVVFAGLVVGGVSGASGSGSSGSRNFTAIEITRTEKFVDVDNSQSGPTVGDEFISKNVLKNRSETKKIGSTTVICTFTSVSQENFTVHCVATVKLSGGTLEVAGLIAGPSFKAAIVGGTGSYDKAHGQLLGTDLGNDRNLLRFDID